MTKCNIRQFHGVIPAMVTPFDETGEVDVKRTRALTEYLIGRGVQGLYLTGSTGEGFLMTAEERNRVVDATLEAAAGRVPVVVHIGDIGTKKSIELARYAMNAGADGISTVPPFYWKFSEDDIYGYYADIAAAVPAPLIVYNIALAGLMGMRFVRRLAEIDTVCGLKFTSREHDDMAELKADLGADFMIYSGCDQMAVSGMLHGADGIIGSYYNLMPEIFIEMLALLRDNRWSEAMRLQGIANRVIHHLHNYDFFCVMREYLRRAGLVDCGYSRAPFTAPSAAQYAQIDAFLRELKARYGDTHLAVVEALFSA